MRRFGEAAFGEGEDVEEQGNEQEPKVTMEGEEDAPAQGGTEQQVNGDRQKELHAGYNSE